MTSLSGVNVVSTWIVGRQTLLQDGVKAALSRSRFDVVNCLSLPFDTEALIGRHEPKLCLYLSDTLDDETVREDVQALRRRLPRAIIVVIVFGVKCDPIGIFESGANACFSFDLSAEELRVFLERTIAMEYDFFVFSIKRRSIGSVELPGSVIDISDFADYGSPPTATGPAGISDPYQLSLREREILAGLFEGDSNKTLARRLAISDATVKTHVRTVFRKLDAHSRSQAIRRIMAVCPKGEDVGAWLLSEKLLRSSKQSSQKM